MKLTELNSQLAEARARAAAGSRQEFGVERGLRVRVYPSGKASFAYRYRTPGEGALRTITLAPIGKRISSADLESVSELHRAAKRNLISGVDPKVRRDRLRRQAAEEAARARDQQLRKTYTVRQLVNDYVDVISSRKRSWKEDERIFNRYVLSEIGEMPVVEVSLRDVRRVLGKLDGKVAMKRNVAAACRTCWKWNGGPNPWKEERVAVPPPRDRVLSIKELRELVDRLDSDSGSDRDIVELILLTGTRREEASAARREEFEDGEWRIPAERNKSGRSHTILLSTQAKALIDRVLGSHTSEWLFPSKRGDKAAAPEFAYKWVKANGASYALHDLRRTLSSYLGESLAPDAVIDRVLGHTKRGVIRHYNHARLNEPARSAWQDWADHLEGLRETRAIRNFEHVLRLGRKKGERLGVSVSDEWLAALEKDWHENGETSAGASSSLDAAILAKKPRDKKSPQQEVLKDILLASPKIDVSQARRELERHPRFLQSRSNDETFALSRGDESDDYEEYRWSVLPSALSKAKKISRAAESN